MLGCSAVASHRRPQYTTVERMAILELRAMRGWNKAETSRHFFVSDDTVRAWLRRVDDDSLVQTRTPVNRFPDFVRYAVQQIKLFCPTLGKVKIADTLARAGIHIGKTTIQRILTENPIKPPDPTTDDSGKQLRIVSKYPGHTWHADLTAVPISGGFWTNWIPNAICQRWPVCWWVLNVIDHFSRRCMGAAVFKYRPTSEEVTAALDRIMSEEQIRPKHLIVDQGPEFKCEHFEHVWCKAMNILPRFGAVGKLAASPSWSASTERSRRSYGCSRCPKIKRNSSVRSVPSSIGTMSTVPMTRWAEELRMRSTFLRPPANEQPRFEPRKRWSRGSPCAKPQVGIDGEPGDSIVLEIDCYKGHRHLPIVRARRVA